MNTRTKVFAAAAIGAFGIVAIGGMLIGLRGDAESGGPPSDRVPEDTPVVELHDNGVVIWTSGTGDINNIPPDMQVTKNIAVISRCSQPLENVKVIPSCGCTQANLDRTSLAPGDRARLTFTYDSQGRRGETTVTMQLVSLKERVLPFRVVVKCNIAASAAEAFLSTEPHSIQVDQPWAPELQASFDIDLKTGKRVKLDSLRVGSTSPHLVAHLVKRDPEGSGLILRATLRSQPPGPFKEAITVEFTADQMQYCHRVPIQGVIRSRYNASPPLVSATHRAGRIPEPEVVISARDHSAGKPILSVEGDWRIKEVVTLGPSQYRVKLSLSRPLVAGHYAGRLLIGGDLGENPLTVPVFMTLVREGERQ